MHERVHVYPETAAIERGTCCRRGQVQWSALLLLLSVGVSACGTLLAPRPPIVFSEESYSKTRYEEHLAAYTAALDSSDIPKATRIRNAMLWSSIRDVNHAYFKFRNEFNEVREWTNTTMDMAKLGMSAAATVLGGNAALSAAVTALEGTSLSVQKNFFREKTTETLFTTMDALRNEQMASIQTKLLLAPPAYGFEEAFNDAVLLFNAGNVLSALERITAEAGKQATEAKDKNETATQVRVDATLSPTTKDALKRKENLSKIVTNLASDPTDAGKLTLIKTILVKRGVEVSATDKPDDLYRKLKGVLRQAQGDEKINELVDVFKEAGVWKE